MCSSFQNALEHTDASIQADCDVKVNLPHSKSKNVALVWRFSPSRTARMATLASFFWHSVLVSASPWAPRAAAGASEVINYSWNMERNGAVPLCGSYPCKRDRTGCVRSTEKVVTLLILRSRLRIITMLVTPNRNSEIVCESPVLRYFVIFSMDRRETTLFTCKTENNLTSAVASTKAWLSVSGVSIFGYLHLSALPPTDCLLSFFDTV